MQHTSVAASLRLAAKSIYPSFFHHIYSRMLEHLEMYILLLPIYSRTAAENQDDKGDQYSKNPTCGKLECCTTHLHVHSPSSYEVPASKDQSESSFPNVTDYNAVNIHSKRTVDGQTYDDIVLNRGLPYGQKISSMIAVHLSSVI